MPSNRAILADLDATGLNPAKAHSHIKASGKLGVNQPVVSEESKKVVLVDEPVATKKELVEKEVEKLEVKETVQDVLDDTSVIEEVVAVEVSADPKESAEEKSKKHSKKTSKLNSFQSI